MIDWARSGLFRRFALWMGLLAMVPVLVLGAWVLNLSQRGIEDAVLELQTNLAEKLSIGVDDYLASIERGTAFILGTLRSNAPWGDKTRILKRFLDANPDVSQITILDERGRELLKAYNPDSPLAGEAAPPAPPALRAAMQEGRTLLTARLAAGLPVVDLYHPLPPRIVRFELSLKSLADRIAGERVGGTGFAVLIDAKGVPLAYPAGKLDAAQVKDFARWPIIALAKAARSVGSESFVAPGGRSYVGAYAPSRRAPLAIVVLQDSRDAFAASRSVKRTLALAAVAVIFLSLLGAGGLVRHLTRPILSLTQAAQRVARGDFSAKVSLRTDDEIRMLAETFNGMTDQLRAYAELQVDRLLDEQRKTQAILFSISDGILMVDAEGRVLLGNRRAGELLGWDHGVSLEGERLDDLLAASPLQEAVLSACQSPRLGMFRDVDVPNGDKRRYLRVLSHPIVAPENAASKGFVLALRDVTVERELDKMKEDFLHYITHDLRNPIGSAMGFLDVLLKEVAGGLNAEQKGMVSSVKRSLTRLLGMVNNILDIAKMDAGKVRIQLNPLVLADAASRAISILESLAQRKSVSVALVGDRSCEIQGDSDMLERVFVNLLGNAIKVTPEGGRIEIAIKDFGDVARAIVKDSGEGIPKEFLGRLFGKFEQVQNHSKGGTGLGLAIVKFFVQAHLGRVWAESEPGSGATFLFEIPKNLCLDEEGVVRQVAAASK